jgi:hypothetical protein
MPNSIVFYPTEQRRMMNPPVIERFQKWLMAECDQSGLIYFRRCFAAIWLVYDLIDLTKAEFITNLWFLGITSDAHFVITLQVLVIGFELGLLFGFYPRICALGAGLTRAVFAYNFGLNDFIYFAVICFILTQVDPKSRRAWPRDVLVLQTAWIYFASAILKMNPSFVSGGDLYVRQNYEAAVLPIPYPAFYLGWISDIQHDAYLAYLTIAMELILPVILFSWWFFPKRRKILRSVAIAMAVAMHGFAAYALNVFFFGLSLIIQILFITQSEE